MLKSKVSILSRAHGDVSTLIDELEKLSIDLSQVMPESAYVGEVERGRAVSSAAIAKEQV